jgi:hypothetical protein
MYTSSTSFDDLVSYYFVLRHYTGTHRTDGRLRISTSINNTIQPIHIEPWYFDTIRDVYLINGSDYLIESYIPGIDTKSYGWITPTADGSKELFVTEIPPINYTDHYEGVEYYFSTNYQAGTIALVYNITSETSINSATLLVYNSSDELVHNVTSLTPAGTITYTATNNNQSFRAVALLDIPGHSIHVEQIVLAWNELYEVIKDIALPDVFDIDSYDLQIFTVWTLMVAIMLIGGAATIEVVAVLVLALVGFFGFVGWLEQYWIHIFVTAFFTGMIVLAKDRRRTV